MNENINNAVEDCLLMINKHNNLHLKELKEFTLEECKKHNVKVLCHSCVCLDIPGIVTYIVYGGVTQESDKKYVYFVKRG